jgi:hypothetical protein
MLRHPCDFAEDAICALKLAERERADDYDDEGLGDKRRCDSGSNSQRGACHWDATSS